MPLSASLLSYSRFPISVVVHQRLSLRRQFHRQKSLFVIIVVLIDLLPRLINENRFRPIMSINIRSSWAFSSTLSLCVGTYGVFTQVHFGMPTATISNSRDYQKSINTTYSLPDKFLGQKLSFLSPPMRQSCCRADFKREQI